MTRTSERDRTRNRTDADLSSVNKAQSFRLDQTHMEKLRKMSRRTDISQVKILRKLIDQEHERLFPS